MTRNPGIQTMSNSLSRYRLALGALTIAGTVVLAGCAADPVTRTVTSQQTTTVTPPPMVTTTTTTDQTGDFTPSEPVAKPHPRHRTYAQRHPVHHDDDTTDVVTKDTTVDTTVTPGVPTVTTSKATQTTTVR